MSAKRTFAAIALLAGCTFASAQQITQPELKVDSTNRTLTVAATGSISVEPELAILHIGFDTQPEDAKSAPRTPSSAPSSKPVFQTPQFRANRNTSIATGQSRTNSSSASNGL